MARHAAVVGGMIRLLFRPRSISGVLKLLSRLNLCPNGSDRLPPEGEPVLRMEAARKRHADELSNGRERVRAASSTQEQPVARTIVVTAARPNASDPQKHPRWVWENA